jgi:6-phosphogluconolactonase/glucosamine-6-phosphate isomerase/deaminase
VGQEQHGTESDERDLGSATGAEEHLGQVEGERGSLRYVSVQDPASYEAFAYAHLLDPLRKKTGASIPVLKPDLDALDSFKPRIDLLILALGVGGNYANVMPGTKRPVGWHVAGLLPEFRQAHTQAGSESYAGAQFREFGMSLGPQQVLAAGRVVVIVRGEKKHQLTEELLTYDKFDPEFPLSIIYDADVTERVDVFIQDDVGVQL